MSYMPYMSRMPRLFARLRAKRPAAPLHHVLFYEFIRATAGLLFVFGFRARGYHPERVPPAGPLLLAGNHQSYLDPPLIGAFLGHRHISYIARSGLFRFKPLGWFITALSSIPIRENSGDAAAIREILRRLELGDAVLIFPEGSRTPDGKMQEFKRGVALLVKKARCPVVPVAVDGCYDAWPRSRKMPRLFRRRIAVLYGQPIAYDDLMKYGAEAALQRVEREVQALLDELRAKGKR